MDQVITRARYLIQWNLWRRFVDNNSCFKERLNVVSWKVNHAWDEISASKCKLLKLKHESVFDELFASRSSIARVFRRKDETCYGAELIFDTKNVVQWSDVRYSKVPLWRWLKFMHVRMQSEKLQRNLFIFRQLLYWMKTLFVDSLKLSKSH